MLCMFCNCVQKASGLCSECDQSAAGYYCNVCKLCDNSGPKQSIYAEAFRKSLTRARSWLIAEHNFYLTSSYNTQATSLHLVLSGFSALVSYNS